MSTGTAEAAPEQRVQFTGGEVTTPRLRTTARRWVFWVGMALVLVVITLLSIVAAGSPANQDDLSATNPGQNGAEALIQVLKQDNVTVETPRSLAAATRDAQGRRSSTTVVLYDENNYLSRAQLQAMASLASNVVLIEPSARAVRAIAPGITLQAGASSPVRAHCSFGPAKRAASVTGFDSSFGTVGVASASGCFPRGLSYSLVRVTQGKFAVTLVGGADPFTNSTIARTGNAAFALGLFGATDNLIWFRPSLADLPAHTPDGNVPLPPWVYLAIVLAGIVVLAACLWRGRRFGPLVVEQMPVFVRSNETVEGRARLYQKSSARSHALDALRIGTISRLSTLCGLPTRASVDEVIAAVARVLDRDPAPIRELLLDEHPTSDRALIALSDRLLDLEHDVERAVIPA